MKEIQILNEVLKSIENFNKEILKKPSDFTEIKEYITYLDGIFMKHFKIFHNMTQIIKPKLLPFKMFRVREYEPIKNKDLFNEYSYPPTDFVGDGRCNFKKKPVFYCSNNPITALLEVIRNTEYKSKKFCISTWSLIDNNEDLIIDNFLQSNLHPLNIFQNLANSQIENIDKVFEQKLNNEQKLGIIEFYKFLDSKFIEDKDYSISSFLAHRRLYADHNFRSDIIIYPSVQTESKSVNFAIQPNFVDNCMKIERFYIVELDYYDKTSNKFSLTFSKYGKIEKNVILWRNLKLDDLEDYEENFKNDFKAYLDNPHEFNYVKNTT
ncbi:RES domain-containing protein [Flavobacterium degerlachei]|jgi:hypothetical protein|uniref:RES domain-containing protein n=1 Tax=Flavobacterium degerlachei TaxID=229203 RepID=A0A1H3B360_9FLAO|nr:RES domain-containing protein [Flavobacterium degerlachei]SDX36118.1 RES domain-containing protein [Flavobacterium degerlachei]